MTPAGLTDADVQELIASLLDVLGPYPDARAAVAAALKKGPGGAPVR